MKPLVAFACESCGQIVFPARALCPRCGDHRWSEQPLAEGVVEQATDHRGVPIVSVRTDRGLILIARGSARPGMRVHLADDDGAPVASV